MPSDAASWLDFAVKLLVLAGLVGGLLWALIVVRGRRIWVARSEYHPEQFVTRVEFRPDQWVTRKEWEMHQQRQAERIAEVIVEPLSKIADRLDRMSEEQARIIAAQARSEERDKAFGRSLDELRERVNDRERREVAR